MRHCPNDNHGCAAAAIATVSWPDGRYRPTDACSGCVRQMFADALAEGWPIAIDPIAEAYGICPSCARSVRLRPSGLVTAHQARLTAMVWRTCAGRGQKPKQARRG